MISVLILTRNEEANLPGCLESVGWSDDVVVFDSYSDDRTTELARAAGARVEQRVFDNYGAQREAALRQVTYKHPWLLVLDADERPETALVVEMHRLIADDANTHTAFRMRRKDHFMGHWIKHATLYPSWFVRLLRPDCVHYEPRSVHEYPLVDGTVGELESHLIHYSFNKGLTDWLAKHNRYAELEAAENLRSVRGRGVDWRGLFSGSDPVRRRRALKELSFRLPCRPTLRFLYMYLIRRGLLDGAAGWTYCRLLALYEYLIVLKTRELRRREQGLPI